MHKSCILFFTVLFTVFTASAQKNLLRFNGDGSFKIVQFTDVHYKVDDRYNSQKALDCMRNVLDVEKPDIVMFTGDIVVSDESFKGLDIVLDACISRDIPFAVVFGNHDDEYDHSRQELYDYVANKEGCLMPVRTKEGLLDYVLAIKSSRNKVKDAALLYCMDSHSYTQIKSVPGYDWIKHDQIAWYREKSREFSRQNAGEPLPALAFFHIPIPEYRDALLEDKNRMFGVRGEGVACPTANSGFFLSMKECGDIMGVFVGHDHNNDYAVMYKEILLAYGRYSGGNTVYNDIANGARVIILKEGDRKFSSYIRLTDGETESQIFYPDSFN